MSAERPVVARCRRCHGVTMFHADGTKDTGKYWSDLARHEGDLITTYDASEAIELGPYCPDSWGKKPSERRCPIVAQPEPDWSPYVSAA